MVQHLKTNCILTPLKIIPGEKGDVLRALKKSEDTFFGFGEAYFSTVKKGQFKGWKKHSRMVLNLIVPVGSIRFYIVDLSRDISTDTIVLSTDNYCRLTVMPGIWLGFEGIGDGTNLLLNIATVEHDPTEAESCDDAVFKSHFKEFFKI